MISIQPWMSGVVHSSKASSHSIQGCYLLRSKLFKNTPFLVNPGDHEMEAQNGDGVQFTSYATRSDSLI